MASTAVTALAALCRAALACGSRPLHVAQEGVRAHTEHVLCRSDLIVSLCLTDLLAACLHCVCPAGASCSSRQPGQAPLCVPAPLQPGCTADREWQPVGWVAGRRAQLCASCRLPCVHACMGPVPVPRRVTAAACKVISRVCVSCCVVLCCLQTLCVVVVRQHTQRRRSPRQQQQQLPVQGRAPGPLAQHPRARHPPQACRQLVPLQQGHLPPQCLGSLSGLWSTTGQVTSLISMNHAGLLTTDRDGGTCREAAAETEQWQRWQCHVGAMRGCCVGLAVLCGACLAAKPSASCCWCKAGERFA